MKFETKYLAMAFVYIAWFAFVFAMCYLFSPWFALLLIVSPNWMLED